MLDIKGQRILIHRSGAYGDQLHISHIPRMLKEQGCSFLGFSMNHKGLQLFKHNPFIDKIHFFDGSGRKVTERYYDTRLRILSQDYDRTIDFSLSLEEGALAMERQNIYYQHINQRRKIGERNYYDIGTNIAGFPELCGKYRGEVFYTDEEVKTVEHDLLREGRFKNNFKVMINLGGSGPHKIFIQAREVAKMILERYPEAVIFTTGDKNVRHLDFTELGDRIRPLSEKKPFRQVLLMTKYMNCVIGCESGMMVGASMWDVPTIQLLTATSKLAHCKYAENDYSLQSPARCSPCYRGPYLYYGCPKKDLLPLCVYFDTNLIMEQVDKTYARFKARNGN